MMKLNAFNLILHFPTAVATKCSISINRDENISKLLFSINSLKAIVEFIKTEMKIQNFKFDTCA